MNATLEASLEAQSLETLSLSLTTISQHESAPTQTLQFQVNSPSRQKMAHDLATDNLRHRRPLP